MYYLLFINLLFPSIHPSVRSIHPSMLLIHSLVPSIHPSFCCSIYHSVILSFYLSFYLLFYHSIHCSIYCSIIPSIVLSFYHSIYRSILLSSIIHLCIISLFMSDPSIYVYMNVCVCVYMYVCVCVFVFMCVWCVCVCVCVYLCFGSGTVLIPRQPLLFIAFSGNCIFSLCLYPPPCLSTRSPPLPSPSSLVFFSVILKGLTLLAPWWLLFHFILIKILRAFFNIPVWYYLNNLALFPLCVFLPVCTGECVCFFFLPAICVHMCTAVDNQWARIIDMMIMNMCLNLFTFICMTVWLFF